MDFRMDKSSWAMIAFMIATMMFFIIKGAGAGLSTSGYLMSFGYALLTTLVLICLMCIPVLIYCYFKKVIPDIDYSIRAATIFTVIGIISELIF